VTTDCNNLLQRLAVGAIIKRPAVAHFKRNSIVFCDESEEEVDAVIWATGFMRSSKVAKTQLWNHVWEPGSPGLAHILQVHPIGSHWCVADAQACWVADVFTGRVKLPSIATMLKESARVQESQFQDIAIDWEECLKIAKLSGRGPPSYALLLWNMLCRPKRTRSYLMQSLRQAYTPVSQAMPPVSETVMTQPSSTRTHERWPMFQSTMFAVLIALSIGMLQDLQITQITPHIYKQMTQTASLIHEELTQTTSLFYKAMKQNPSLTLRNSGRH